jgi:hypothetical protein
VAKHPLDVTSAALLERVDKEDARAPTTAKSHLIGGIAVVGSKLDDFLRNLLIAVADAAGRDPTEFLTSAGVLSRYEGRLLVSCCAPPKRLPTGSRSHLRYEPALRMLGDPHRCSALWSVFATMRFTGRCWPRTSAQP